MNFKLYFAIKHPLDTLKWLLRLNRKEIYKVIKLEGAKYCLDFLGIKQVLAKRYLQELENSGIHEIIQSAIYRWPKTDPSRMRYVKGPLLYVITRTLRPKVVVETGVASGVSTLFILQALNDNSFGTLYSIDLPNIDKEAEIPKEEHPGWIIPDNLKRRWVLRLGDAKYELPKLLNTLGRIDIYLHDSLHTYDHMLWEYKMAWPHIIQEGVLLSDDVMANRAFRDFVKQVKVKSMIIMGLGLARKA